MMLMLNVPATIGLIALASPIVSLLLERGRFTAADTAATAAALIFYAPGLLGYSAVKIASPSFYSMRDSRTPVTVSVLSVLANLMLNLAFIRVLGYRGLALGTSLAAMFNAGALLWLLRRRLDGLDGRRIAVAFVKIAIASTLMGGAGYSIASALATWWPDTSTIARAVHVAGAIGGSLGVLVISAKLLRIQEFEDAAALVLRRLTP
jgi:putative peptidoglycan lipid II flippase